MTLDRTSAPSATPIENIELRRAQSTTLDNNIPLHTINVGEQEVVRLELVFKAGNWDEPKTGVAFFAFKMLNEGTKTKNARDINAYIDQFGSFLDLEISMDYSTLTLYSLPKHLYKLVPLLKEMVFESTFPAEELTTLKAIKKQRIQLNEKKNSIVAAHKFREALFGDQHPYGRYLSLQDVDAITLEDVNSYYEQFIKDNFEIILSGKLNDDSVKLINDSFGKHPISKPTAKPRFTPKADLQQILLEKPESLQSSIRIGKILFTKSHEDFLEMQVVNEILGGYFGSRLMRNIREDKGFTYGIGSNILTLKNEGFFILGTDVKKQYTEQTLEEIYKEIKILQTEAVEQEELDTVRNYMLGSLLSSINTPFAVADKFKSVYFNNLNYEHYTDYVHVINTITSDRIMQLANKYLKVESLSEIVVGGKS